MEAVHEEAHHAGGCVVTEGPVLVHAEHLMLPMSMDQVTELPVLDGSALTWQVQAKM